MKFYFFKFKGLNFQELGLINESNKNLHKSYEYFEHLKGSLDPSKKTQAYLGYVELANNYIKLNQMDNASIYFRKALSFCNKYVKESVGKASALNNIGIHFFENLKKNDSAMHYFLRAEKLMHKNDVTPKQKMFLGSIRDNIANVYLVKGEYKKAKRLFKQNYNWYAPENYILAPESYVIEPDYERWYRAGLQLAETNIKLEEFNEAKRILNDIKTKIDQFDFYKKTSIRLRYLENIEALAIIERNHKKAYQFAIKKQQLQDSIDRISTAEINTWNENLQHISLERIKATIENKQLKQQQIEAEKRLKLGVFVGILAIITLILLYLFIRYQQKIKGEEKAKYIAEQEASLLALNNELLNKDIALKKNDLTDTVTQLSQNQKWIKTLAGKIKKIQLTQGRERASILEAIEQEVSTHLQENQSTQEFNRRVAQLSDEFYKKLEIEFPKLTKADIKLCAMIRLGIGNNEIAILQNINPSSVHQSRYRLKKKLNIEEDLDTFLAKY